MENEEMFRKIKKKKERQEEMVRLREIKLQIIRLKLDINVYIE